MRDGFVARAEAVNRLLRDVRTTFLLVTTLEAVPAREAEEMAEALSDRHLHLGLLVCNKALPPTLSDPGAASAADRLLAAAPEMGAALAPKLRGRPAPADVVTVVLEEVSRSFTNFRLVATREAELLRELSSRYDVAATVGYHAGNITDLEGLLSIGATIWGDDPSPDN
jgi:hypothetical protein